MNPDHEFLLRRIEDLLENEEAYLSFFMDNPVPSWHKSIDGDRLVMDIVNPAYTAYTGISMGAYKGREDRAVWGQQVGETFSDNDRKVLETRTRVAIEELTLIPNSGKEVVWVGWKWPRFDQEGRIIGIWGSAIPYDKEIWDNMSHFRSQLRSNADG